MSDSKASQTGYRTTDNATILVTGSTGFVGARLVEMLLERNAKHVICFDVIPPSDSLKRRFEMAASSSSSASSSSCATKNGSKLSYFSGPIHGDITNRDSVYGAFQSQTQIDVVYHIAALVGPFHDRSKYMQVNYTGTMHIINACRTFHVSRLIFSSSPSTRFTGVDIEGLKEEELPIPDTFLALYAETKAHAERAVSKACCAELLTISIAPHQVYGPYDSLFLPSLLETAGNGRLRIFGRGENKISMCYVDNYCHGLLCGADALHVNHNTQVWGKFYIITDGPEQKFWHVLNDAIVAMGFTDLFAKFHLPTWFLYGLAYCANVLGWLLRKKFKLNPFNVKMLTMHRYFSIENAKKDLGYEPLFTFEEAWNDITIEWFTQNWLPGFLESKKKGGGVKKKSD